MDEERGYGTNFTESEILLAVINEDEDYAWSLIGGMMPGERVRLALSCSRLARMIKGT
jgi:hypothetical protein